MKCNLAYMECQKLHVETENVGYHLTVQELLEDAQEIYRRRVENGFDSKEQIQTEIDKDIEMFNQAIAQLQQHRKEFDTKE